MYKCNKILLPPIRTKISYVIISMRKPVTSPIYPHSPTINRYILIRSQSFSVGSYLRGSKQRGGLM